MISLKRSLDTYESIEQSQAATLACLLAALASIERHAAPSQEGIPSRHRAALRALRRQVAADPNPEVPHASTDYLDDELKEYAGQTSEFYQSREVEVRAIIRLMAKASGSLQANNDNYSARFGNFAKELESLVEVEELPEIRRRLAREVERLRACVREMSTSTATSLGPLRQQVKQYEQRLKQAEEIASRDPLSGAANCREGERQIIERVKSRHPFRIIFLDLLRFKTINDRMGHLAGDEILRQFTRKLQSAVREGDTVCRWGGDEFIVVMNCTPPDAMMRARQVSTRVFGQYSINVRGKPQLVEVQASSGVAEHRGGETAEALFQRAGAILYREKSAQEDRYA
jgi:diguanylate cyclase (GGDEF)-like protein